MVQRNDHFLDVNRSSNLVAIVTFISRHFSSSCLTGMPRSFSNKTNNHGNEREQCIKLRSWEHTSSPLSLIFFHSVVWRFVYSRALAISLSISGIYCLHYLLTANPIQTRNTLWIVLARPACPHSNRNLTSRPYSISKPSPAAQLTHSPAHHILHAQYVSSAPSLFSLNVDLHLKRRVRTYHITINLQLCQQIC